MPSRGPFQTLARVARRHRHGAPAEAVTMPAVADTLPSLFRSIGIDRDYEALDFGGLSIDLHGWWGANPIFEHVFREIRPEIVIEVGSWKGGSVLYMHELSRKYDCAARFICVDTWLGSNDSLWLDPDCRKHLLLRGGYPTMFRQFVYNIVERGGADAIFPLPMTSTAAARVLRKLNVVADAIYIDGGHEQEEVAADLLLYYELLRPGGAIFGDDYHTRWSGVIRAVDAFGSAHGLEVRVEGTQWLLSRPMPTSRSRWWR